MGKGVVRQERGNTPSKKGTGRRQKPKKQNKKQITKQNKNKKQITKQKSRWKKRARR
jgi:hypothetical protein